MGEWTVLGKNGAYPISKTKTTTTKILAAFTVRNKKKAIIKHRDLDDVRIYYRKHTTKAPGEMKKAWFYLIYNFIPLNQNLKKYYMHYYKLFQKYKCPIGKIIY